MHELDEARKALKETNGLLNQLQRAVCLNGCSPSAHLEVCDKAKKRLQENLKVIVALERM